MKVGAARLPAAAEGHLKAQPTEGNYPGAGGGRRGSGRRALGAQVPPSRAEAAVPQERSAPKQKTASRKLFQGAPEGQGQGLRLRRAGSGALRASPEAAGSRVRRRRRPREVGLQLAALRAPAGKSLRRARRSWERGAAGSSPRRPGPGKGKGPRRGRGPGSARSPRSSSPSLNWPLWLIRSCCPSSGCGGSPAGGLSGPGAAAKGAWPRGRGGTAGPAVLRRSLPAAVSMARGGGCRRRRRERRGLESEVRGAAAPSARRDGRAARRGRAGGRGEWRCAGCRGRGCGGAARPVAAAA